MDLSIIIEENGKRDHPTLISEKIAIAKKFGYRRIGLNVRLSSNSVSNIPQPPNVPSTLSDIKDFEILTRLTVKVDDSLHWHKLIKSETQLKYDLLAIEIKDEKILNQFCSGQLNCDIVCLELTNPKLCFILRKANLNLPIEKGIQFEIAYRDLLSSQAIRINTISNGRLLVEKCKGKNVIFSSGAKYKLDFRSPVDVSHLGELFGMKENLSKEAVFLNPYRAVKHSSIRKIPITSVIEENDDEWLKKELKLNNVEWQKKEVDENKKTNESTLKRKDNEDDQKNLVKKAKIDC